MRPHRLTPEEYHQQDLERLRGMRPIDDTFMRCLFRDDLPLAQFVLRILTGIDDLVLVREETQMDMKRLLGARSLCLDVFAVDSQNRQYNIELQRDDRGARPERARYHSAALDVEYLDAGQEFEDLPETYVIFVTEEDLFGQGCGTYAIERVNTATGQIFGDREHILYINGQYSNGDSLGMLMHDFLCSNPEDMHYPILADKARYYKVNTKGVSEMCKAMEDLRNEALAVGRAEGEEIGLAKGEEIGLAKGEEIGLEKGRLSTLIQTIQQLRAGTNLTDDQLRAVLNVSDADWALATSGN